MRVLSLEQGGPCYDGPERVWPARWKHTSHFYVLDPVELGVYVAQSLNDRFHYQVGRDEEHILHQIQEFCRGSSSVFVQITAAMNYHDNNITVIHQPSETMTCFILGCSDDDVLSELLSLGTTDTARGNVKIDTGFCVRNVSKERQGIGFY